MSVVLRRVQTCRHLFIEVLDELCSLAVPARQKRQNIQLKESLEVKHILTRKLCMISYDTANHGFESVMNGRMNFKIDDSLIFV